MIDYKRELNPEQYQVVMEESGVLLVLAGAGSGKTRTLTYRVARLLERGIRQENILLATFTNKAARSMLNRVGILIGNDTKRIMGGTFHHVAFLILKNYVSYVGYKSGFSILDSDDSRQLIAACMSELKLDSKAGKFPKSNILAEIISLATNTQRTLEDVLQTRYPFFLHWTNEIIQTASLYEEKKKELSVMDFDDLLSNCRKLLLQNPDVLQILSERFQHILVDEYQDTNIIQAELVELLASKHKNLMVVGDDSQSIYSFRGANFNNIIDFPRRYPECKIFKLETNYRSTPEILHLANLSINNNENQFPKTLRAIRDKGRRPVLVCAQNVIRQADFVAQRIHELLRAGVPLQEIAVLYRAHYHSMEVQMELVRRGIPFDIRSGVRFFEQVHIKDVTAYMRIFVNPRDELAWRRLLLMYPKIGLATFKKIWHQLRQEENPLETVLNNAIIKMAPRAAQSGLEEFSKAMKILLEIPEGERSPEKIIDTLLNQCGYRIYLQDHYSDFSTREEDLVQLGNFSAQFLQMEDFLNELALLTNMAMEEDIQNGDSLDRIILSTIHQAKGLEWSHVFLIWCADGMLPLQRALKEKDGEEEERRLFYVAVTRARDQLYLCYPALDYNRSAGILNLAPSRFIREIAPLSLRDEKKPFEQWVLYDEY
jgi:DNA helicase-2/ATP-dependent DNA helicase PcrA